MYITNYEQCICTCTCTCTYGTFALLCTQTCVGGLTELRLNDEVLRVEFEVDCDHFAEDGDVVAVERVDGVVERPARTTTYVHVCTTAGKAQHRKRNS